MPTAAVLSRDFRSQTRGDSVPLENLFGCIGEKLKVITTIYAEQISVFTDDNKGWINPPKEISGKVSNDYLFWVEDSSFFNNCQPGDILKHVSDGFGLIYTGTIIEIISGNLARMDVTADQLNLSSGYIYIDTDLKSIYYQYGLGIGGFNSQIDDSLQKYVLNSTSRLSLLSSTAIDGIGNSDWQFNNHELILTGNGSGPSDAAQSVIIEHDFVVLPVFLAGQYDNLKAGLAPDYFLADNKIKYSSLLNYNKSVITSATGGELTLDDVGQFGWFGTRYDGTKSSYSITSLQFKKVSDSSVVNQLEYDPIEIQFIVTSNGASFSATDTALIFGFNYLPDDELYYQNTGRTVEDNFCFDSKFLNPNGSVVNGEKFGTSKQIIKNIKADVLSSTTCRVTVNIDIASGQLPILTQGDKAYYDIWCIVERTDLDQQLSDKSSLLIDVNYIYVQLINTDLLTNNTLFIEHPYDSLQYAEETLTLFPVDDVVANNLITIDYTGLENDGILLKSVTPQIVLKHALEADIVLDSQFISLLNYPIIGALPGVQDIKFQSNRPYKIEDGIRKTITFYRNYSLDSGNIRAWLLSFPFMHRWEYWIKVLGLNPIPLDLFDNTGPFGGANNLWNRLISTSDWTFVYRSTFEIIQNGVTFEQVFDTELTSTNFNSNTDWSDCEITSHDIITDDQIFVGAKQYVYAQQNTLIRAKFTKSTGVVPDVDGVYIVIWAESFEGGGITEIRNIDSGRDVIPASCFTGIDGTKRVSITKNMSTFTGEAILDFSKIPSGQKITIYARIYEYQNGDPLDGRVTNEDILRMTLDGNIRLVN